MLAPAPVSKSRYSQCSPQLMSSCIFLLFSLHLECHIYSTISYCLSLIKILILFTPHSPLGREMEVLAEKSKKLLTTILQWRPSHRGICPENGLNSGSLILQNLCPVCQKSIPICQIFPREGGHPIGLWVQLLIEENPTGCATRRNL